MPGNCEQFNTLSSLSSKFSDLKVIAGGGSGVVLSGFDKSLSESSLPDKDGSQVALKRLSLVGKGHCRVALRELRLLNRFVHENVVKTYKITDSNGSTIDDPTLENFKDLDSVYVVEELLDTDLHKVIERNGKLSLDTTKLFLYQLLRGLKYIHSANVIHRDIKPGNLFVNLDDLTLKIGDYGLARVFDNRYEHKGYLTAVVSTRYYRAPEVMKNLGDYSYPIDMWSCGCVFAEMLSGKILFSGENDLDQLNVICSAYGVTPDNLLTETSSFPEHLFVGLPPEAIDLLSRMLCLDPDERITITEALQHPFLSELHDPIDEPICEYPFQIEHEIDNLPVKILKRKILRNSCVSSYEKKSYHSSEENLFKDFDETFSCYCPTESVSRRNSKNTRNHLSVVTKFNSHGEEMWSSNTNSSVESPTHDYKRYQEDLPKITSESEVFLPSLQDAMSSCQVLIDEPFRDPGVCSRMYHEDDSAPVKSNQFLSADTSNDFSYFSDLSPVIDLSEPCYNLNEKKKDLNNNNGSNNTKVSKNNKMETAPFLGDHGRSSAISIESKKSPSLKKVRETTVKNGHTSTFTEIKFESSTPTNCKSIDELRDLNSEILRTLNERHTASKCNFQAMITDRLSNSSKHFSHWDSLKLWI